MCICWLMKWLVTPSPCGVPPADGHSGADVFPVEQESGRDRRAPHQREDPQVPSGGQDSWEAAGHFYDRCAFRKKGLISTFAGREAQLNGSPVMKYLWRNDNRAFTGEASRRRRDGSAHRMFTLLQNKSTSRDKHGPAFVDKLHICKW